MSPGDDYTFDCPECGESMSVNGPMRDALMENGCVVCGVTVTEDDFCETSDAEA